MRIFIWEHQIKVSFISRPKTTARLQNVVKNPNHPTPFFKICLR